MRLPPELAGPALTLGLMLALCFMSSGITAAQSLGACAFVESCNAVQAQSCIAR